MCWPGCLGEATRVGADLRSGTSGVTEPMALPLRVGTEGHSDLAFGTHTNLDPVTLSSNYRYLICARRGVVA